MTPFGALTMLEPLLAMAIEQVTDPANASNLGLWINASVGVAIVVVLLRMQSTLGNKITDVKVEIKGVSGELKLEIAGVRSELDKNFAAATERANHDDSKFLVHQEDLNEHHHSIRENTKTLNSLIQKIDQYNNLTRETRSLAEDAKEMSMGHIMVPPGKGIIIPQLRSKIRTGSPLASALESLEELNRMSKEAVKKAMQQAEEEGAKKQEKKSGK